MPLFLYTAENSDGESVRQFVEAENTADARRRLEAQGFSGVEFYSSDLGAGLIELYEPETKKLIGKNAAMNLENLRDSRPSRVIFRSLRQAWFVLPALVILGWFGGVGVAVSLIGFLGVVYAVLFLPYIALTQLNSALIWHQVGGARRWLSIIRVLRILPWVSLPAAELETITATIEVLEGRVPEAYARMDRLAATGKIAAPVMRHLRLRVYSAAMDFAKIAQQCEAVGNTDQLSVEESIDYIWALAVRLGRVADARPVLTRLYERELSVWERGFVTYSAGVIEAESGSFERAEFHLTEVVNQFAEFENNRQLEGFRYLVDFYRAWVYSETGRQSEADVLLEVAPKYFEAIGDELFIRRCREILGK